jgi:hypothetical protein
MSLRTRTFDRRGTTFGRFPDQKGKTPSTRSCGGSPKIKVRAYLCYRAVRPRDLFGQRRMRSFSGSQERETGTQDYFIPELNSSVAIRGCSMQDYQALHLFQNTRKRRVSQQNIEAGKPISMFSSSLHAECRSRDHGPHIGQNLEDSQCHE